MADVLTWIGELARSVPGLADAFGPRPALDPRTRQRLFVAVAEERGDKWSVYVHGAWRDWLGQAEPPADGALVTSVRAAAVADRPLDPRLLDDLVPPPAVRAVRATVATASLAAAVSGAAERVLDAARRPWSVRPSTLGEAVAVGLALPVALPLLGLAAGARAANNLAPAAVPVSVGKDPNLLVHVLEMSAPALLAGTPVRLALRALPVEVAVGVTTGRSAATVRLGRGRVHIENGLAPEAAVVVEGDVEPLLRAASRSMTRQLTSPTP